LKTKITGYEDQSVEREAAGRTNDRDLILIDQSNLRTMQKFGIQTTQMNRLIELEEQLQLETRTQSDPKISQG
jgi:hypothetical protein